MEKRFVPAGGDLRSDVGFLAETLGNTIGEIEGKDALELVESARKLSVSLRRGKMLASRELSRLVRAQDDDGLLLLVRAFTAYFQIVNVAEDVFRIRKLKAGMRRGAVPDSAEEMMLTLARNGFSAGEVEEMFNSIALAFVLTPHPTEAQEGGRDHSFRFESVQECNSLMLPSLFRSHVRCVRSARIPHPVRYPLYAHQHYSLKFHVLLSASQA